MLEPVRQSLASGKPLHWQRVNRVPDYVFFDHSIHVAKGIGCSVCHGPVQRMALMRQQQPLTMGWCLNCHRHPERYIRPKDESSTCIGPNRQPDRRIKKAHRAISDPHQPPDGLLNMPSLNTVEIDRRLALKTLAAAISATMARCSRPDDEIIPYADMPEGLVAGEPMRYATALTLWRLWPRFSRHHGRWPADQDRGQSSASLQPRGDRYFRRSRGDVALRSRSVDGDPPRRHIATWDGFLLTGRARHKRRVMAWLLSPAVSSRPPLLHALQLSDPFSGIAMVSLRAGE